MHVRSSIQHREYHCQTLDFTQRVELVSNMMEEQSDCFFMRAMLNNPFSLWVVSLSRGVGVTFELSQVHFSFLTEFKQQHSQTQLHKEDRLFFVKEKLMAPLVTAGE